MTIATTSDPNRENPLAKLVNDQLIHLVPEYDLEGGVTLRNFPVAYKTWGALNAARDNALLVCHALSGSADVSDWWAPLLGPGRALDTARYFVVCFNALGSPYGSCSPLTVDSNRSVPWGAEFPVVSVRDDVRIHKYVLEHVLGVSQVQCVVGGSMGGMHALEWAATFGSNTPTAYVRRVVAIATAARHSAWCIAWGEAQRMAIFADPKFRDGAYTLDDPPIAGLAAARVQAMLTYRSRHSFEMRFGRKIAGGVAAASTALPPGMAHAEGVNHFQSTPPASPHPSAVGGSQPTSSRGEAKVTPGVFTAQSYLRYQGDKFTARFDANCYIALTRKLDTHDIARARSVSADMAPAQSTFGVAPDDAAHFAQVRRLIRVPALIIGVESDGLFALPEQEALAANIDGAELAVIMSNDGHDGFLLEFEQVGGAVARWLRAQAPEIYAQDVSAAGEASVVGNAEYTSMSGEADLVAW